MRSLVSKIWRFGGTLLLVALAAESCVISHVRTLWAKKRGSESSLFAFEQNGRIGFIDPTGKIIIKPTIVARLEDVGDFSNGLARVEHKGYVDQTGRWVIKQDFWWAYDFSDGLAQVAVDDPTEKYKKLGFVLDTSGKVITRVRAHSIGEFSEGLASYVAQGKPGIRKFEPGNFVYRDYPGLQGFIDRTGNIVIKPQFAEVGPFIGGLARAVLDGYCFVATRDGGREGTPTTGVPGDCGGAPADAVSPCKVGFISTAGDFMIEPRFEAAQDFQDEMAAVRVDGLWGFIDTNGALVIPPAFQQVQSFREGLAAVKLNGSWGFIDGSGRLMISPRFEGVEAFSDSLAIAHVGGRSFYIDRGGRTVIAGPFLEATPFVHGLAAVLLTEKHVAYIDHTGKTVFSYFRRWE